MPELDAQPQSPPALGARSLDRMGLAWLVTASAVLVGADFALAPDARGVLLLTTVESVLLVPWALMVFRLDRQDRERRHRRRWPLGSLLAVHAANVLLLALCLYQKWYLIASSGIGTDLSHPHQYRIFTVAAYVLANVGLLGRGSRVGRLFLSLSDHPARLTALSFGLTSLVGALVLNLPQALRDSHDASFVDGLFTAVSAVCVTGLVVHPTGETYTAFGQGVLLVLFQAGGLGIMVLYSAFAILSGRSLRVRSSAVLAETIDARSVATLKRTVLEIVGLTVLVEGAGAALLYVGFGSHSGIGHTVEQGGPLSGAGSRLWAAIFHSVSAFCNAGFSVFRDGAVPLASDWWVSSTLMVLIILGGLGFPVLMELIHRLRAQLRGRRPPRLSLQSRVALVMTAVLIMLGAVALLALERDRAFAHLSAPDTLLAALFQSVSARTAGFNSIDIGSLSAASTMLLCVLMFIGACPASTAGGIKTTTVAVLLATLRAELARHDAPRLADRSVPAGVTRRAIGVFFVSSALLATLLFALLVFETATPLDLAFETFSAFGTVGLSRGVTEHLSTAGKLWVTLAMLAGRVGPLTIALALARPGSRHGPRLAEESLTIG